LATPCEKKRWPSPRCSVAWRRVGQNNLSTLEPKWALVFLIY
jgi:hypothetical protein